ncbi:hypothetical protein Cgig2_027837 [Carnegiea gigantea]|uniref:Prolamin-like domain-containing protein n=1 Tax=Carnegiea gigantea TaxID=171969 RepID=A0A9Q1K1W0_9CARY|nr:hypothetical protein Cgig2_027837 [Carnegiea gigantea]
MEVVGFYSSEVGNEMACFIMESMVADTLLLAGKSLACLLLMTGALLGGTGEPSGLDAIENRFAEIVAIGQAGVCLTDFWTNLGRPSASCCEALKKIDSSCLSALMPLLSPYIGPMLDGLCNAAGGSGAFPFPPFPFQFPGGAGASHPPPPLAH